MIQEINADAQSRMTKSLEATKQQLARIRTGRAHPSVLDAVKVSYYGVDTPLNQVANIVATDARTLSLTVFDKNVSQAVEKAIMVAGLGLNPQSNGTLIRVPLPALTEERRKDFIKMARAEAEQGRIAVRNVRREANNDLKTLEKDKDISADEAKRGEDMVQKLTDTFIKSIDTALAEKEKELLEF
ncbi:MAG: ribosome recycling factor [Shewanellaceae bacterium]|nr:ribosome recycling factor [Shewanellaceae bacterium]